MKTISYPKKVMGTVTAALFAVPAIAVGFYTAYRLVTLIGN